MSSPLITLGSTLMCLHGGQATPTSINAHVKINGKPILTQTSSCGINHCALTSQEGGPCETAQWLTGTTRIKANNIPIICATSQSITAPTGQRLAAIPDQFRVKGQ